MRKRVISTLVALVAFAFVLPLDATASESAPKTVQGATTIDVAKAKELFDQGVVFVDPRKDADWDAGRIPGAEHLEISTALTKDNLAAVVGQDQPVVFYCNGEKCMVSPEACKKAVKWGWKQVYFFRAGFPAWKAAGLPIE